MTISAELPYDRRDFLAELDERSATAEQLADAPAPSPGDFRGKYGFGRPAHMSDPQATYSFNPARRQGR